MLPQQVIVNFYIDNVDAPSLLLKIPSVCINRGASCTGAGGEKFSHVPKALVFLSKFKLTSFAQALVGVVR